MNDTKIGHFDIVRLTEDTEIIYCEKAYKLEKGTIGITLFEPFAGVGIYFENTPKGMLVDIETLKQDNSIEYIFKNICSTVRIEHIRDDVNEDDSNDDTD